MRARLPAAAAACALAAACGGGPTGDAPGLAERLRGQWACHRESPDGEFVRTDDASLEVMEASLRYYWNISWECAPGMACTEPVPGTFGNYYEGLYRVEGDSVILQDSSATVSFRDITDSALTFGANGQVFPMRRR